MHLSNQNHSVSYAETGISSTRNSKDSSNLSIKTEKNIELQLEIEDSLKKLSEKYYQYDNKSSLFNYYCSPFIYNSQNKKDFIFVDRYKENYKVNNDNFLYRNCPFESCNEK